MTLLEQWHDMVNNGTKYPFGHFELLFIEHDDADVEEQVVGDIPGAPVVRERLAALRAGTDRTDWGYRVGSSDIGLDVPATLQKLQANLLAWLPLHGAADLAAELEGLPIVEVDRIELDTITKDLSHLGYGINDWVGDEYHGVSRPAVPHFGQLYRAVEFKTKFPAVAMYILDPVAPAGFDFEPDFQLFLAGTILYCKR